MHTHRRSMAVRWLVGVSGARRPRLRAYAGAAAVYGIPQPQSNHDRTAGETMIPGVSSLSAAPRPASVSTSMFTQFPPPFLGGSAQSAQRLCSSAKRLSAFSRDWARGCMSVVVVGWSQAGPTPMIPQSHPQSSLLTLPTKPELNLDCAGKVSSRSRFRSRSRSSSRSPAPVCIL